MGCTSAKNKFSAFGLHHLCNHLGSGFSAVGSAHVWGARGRWFESSNPDKRKSKPLIISSLDFFYTLNWRAFGMIIIGNDIPDDTNLYFFIGDIQKFGAAYRVERCRLSTRLLGAIEAIGAA